VAKQYIALARSQVVPNRAGVVPGTVGYVSNNYLSAGGTTEEKTNKFSIKLDHQLSDRHRLSYLFNRGTDSIDPGSGGAAGPPSPFNTFQSSSYHANLHRATWDWIGSRLVNHFIIGANTFNKDSFSPNVGGDCAAAACGRRSVFGFLADEAQSRGQQLSGGRSCLPAMAPDAKAPAR
jgi:hypothetical protein